MIKHINGGFLDQMGEHIDTDWPNMYKRPGGIHELVSVFYDKAHYFPIKTINPEGMATAWCSKHNVPGKMYGVYSEISPFQGIDRYKPAENYNPYMLLPKSIIHFSQLQGKERIHPTQKPIEQMVYFVRTYTQPGETVLDFTMGSGTTGVACKQLGRNFIGIEIDQKYFDIAKQRIDETVFEPSLFEEKDYEDVEGVNNQLDLFDLDNDFELDYDNER